MEDPEKTKRWGFVSAKPSEYLVHVRRGRIRKSSSGQGASCFKWPWDSVAIVPTSLQRLHFKADQITREKVGVEVKGLAVYRIAEPLLAYRVLNFSFPERAQEKLESTLTDMCVGAIRRLIASLSVDDCLTKRKSALSEELLRELAPVVGGEGRPEDGTDKGWGIVIDTIEIQEVRVLSEKVFAAMQAPFRAQLEREAREATAQAEKLIATREAECTREAREAKILAERELSIRQLRAEHDTEEAKLEKEAKLRERRAELDRRADLEASGKAVLLAELAVKEAEAEIAAAPRRAEALELEASHRRAQAQIDGEIERERLELERMKGELAARIRQLDAEADVRKSEADARRLSAQNLPALAEAIGKRIAEVRIAQYGESVQPLAFVAQLVGAIKELAREASAG